MKIWDLSHFRINHNMKYRKLVGYLLKRAKTSTLKYVTKYTASTQVVVCFDLDLH